MKRSCSGVLCTYYYYINVYKFVSLRRGRKVYLEATCSINEYLHDPVGFNSWRDHVTLQAKSVNRELLLYGSVRGCWWEGNGGERPEKDSLLTAGELRTCVQITNAIRDVIMEKVTFRAVSFGVRQIKVSLRMHQSYQILQVLSFWTVIPSIDELTKIVLVKKLWCTYCVFLFCTIIKNHFTNIILSSVYCVGWIV